MRLRSGGLFQTARTEGGLLPADLLQRVADNDGQLDGLKPSDYHLATGERLNEAITRSWNRLLGAWRSFDEARAQRATGDRGGRLTRERWLHVLFDELGYGRLVQQPAVEIEGKSYAVFSQWQHAPIHLVGCGVKVDTRTPGVAGAAGQSPHSLLQELLNRSPERLWGIVSNGLVLRVLRDNVALTRQAYLEFDLEGMLTGEVYPDFVLLWLVCHQSRVEGERPEDCWLERWTQDAAEHGTRALDALRDGVQEAIEILGAGFLAHPANHDLHTALRAGTLDPQDYYRQLLRVVYRLLFLFVAEDRDVLLDPAADQRARKRYREHYSTQRLRNLAQRRRGGRQHDGYEQLKVVMNAVHSHGCAPLGLPALGSFLWSPAAIGELGHAVIANEHLLDALRALASVDDGGVRRTVDFRNLGAEELGSVYEALLELQPVLHRETATFDLVVAPGSERRTTGSYYTPTGLISAVLDSALDPLLDRRTSAEDPEAALLSLRICDPACGSGHFLIAAANRVAKRVAGVRTGDPEPSPTAILAALRDVAGRCIYGVDVNPMAVELCKVALWMETLEPGRPLTYLDAHIRCGDSLTGTTIEELSRGIPDGAFKPLACEPKDLAKSLREQNRAERKGQLSLDDIGASLAQELEAKVLELDRLPDDSLSAVLTKEQGFESLWRSGKYDRLRLAADAWCAAFLMRRDDTAPRLTTGAIRKLANGPAVAPEISREIGRLAAEWRFFHWELEFPQVFGSPSRGFDAVIGNPPWEQIQFDPKELVGRFPELAKAKNLKARKKALDALRSSDPAIDTFLQDAEFRVAAQQRFLHASGEFPLTSFGRLNTAPLFTERARHIVSHGGRVGLIVPTGIATDSFNQRFFRDLIDGQVLISLYDFENKLLLFRDVNPSHKFCLLTLAGSVATNTANFVFFAHRVEDLADPERRFSLDREDFHLLNPETHTCPIFRSSRDASLAVRTYQQLPTLREAWALQGLLMFMMDAVSQMGEPREELEEAGWRLVGNRFVLADKEYLPVYEAKMIHQYDARHNTFDGVPRRSRFGVKAMAVPIAEGRADPDVVGLPRYWMPQEAVAERLKGRLARDWMIVWRDVTNVTTNRRTLMATVLPRVAAGATVPVLLPRDWTPEELMFLLACLNSYPGDYMARQKVGGFHLTFHLFQQLAVLPPAAAARRAPWDHSTTVGQWVARRALELLYTSWDLRPLAADLRYPGPPFAWDPVRRFVIQSELDAAFLHLYGMSRDEASYILDTFPIVRRIDEQQHGEFRTKHTILEIYDTMADASVTNGPGYRTPLDPPPADPRVAHVLAAASST